MEVDIMKSSTPLRYPGGKTKLYKYVEKMIIDNFENPPIYCEPYSGGFGIGIKLLLNNRVSKVYINDIDNAIYSFWYSILNHKNEFVDMIINTPVTIEEWRIQKAIYLSSDATVLQKGFATFFLNRTNRSGILKAGPIGGYSQNGNYKIDCRFVKKPLIDLIESIYERRADIHVSALDGKEFIKQIDSNENNAFIYLDPPYVEKGEELYINAFNNKDHVDLANVVKTLKNKWFVTYDNVPLIHELYKEYHTKIFDISYTVQTKRVANEIAVFSPNLL